jgi:hypothetical protein
MSLHGSLKQPRKKRKINPCWGQIRSQERKRKNKAASIAALAAEAKKLGISTAALAGIKLQDFMNSVARFQETYEPEPYYPRRRSYSYYD